MSASALPDPRPGDSGALTSDSELTQVTVGALALRYSTLNEEQLAHVQRLMRLWGVLSDLCFADLLMYVPVVDGHGQIPNDPRFVTLGQMRPATSQTLHREDLVGQFADVVARPLLPSCWKTKEIVEGDIDVPGQPEPARMQCIPARYQGKVVAIMSRESPALSTRRPGELERAYLDTYDRFARMITEGTFPYDVDDGVEDLPRVGDGVLILDQSQRITYISPNAVNALHRMGVHSNMVGLRLDEGGVDATAVHAAYTSGRPVTEEIERQSDVIVLIRVLPLLNRGETDGALLLSRDITDIRRRDRMLVSKDATIREVHHRVKNNLQTISSLLRLQARRLPRGDGRTSLEEAERRIRSIALVHEILSRDPGTQVAFEEILRPLVSMAKDVILGPVQSATFHLEGEAGELPAEAATPLAVVLLELLVNAAEHAFASDSDQTHVDVFVGMENDGRELQVRVRDTGVGFPDDFAIEKSNSLGLSIVRGLVETQLNGSMTLSNDNGAVVSLVIPIPHPETRRR